MFSPARPIAAAFPRRRTGRQGDATTMPHRAESASQTPPPRVKLTRPPPPDPTTLGLPDSSPPYHPQAGTRRVQARGVRANFTDAAQGTGPGRPRARPAQPTRVEKPTVVAVPRKPPSEPSARPSIFHPPMGSPSQGSQTSLSSGEEPGKFEHELSRCCSLSLSMIGWSAPAQVRMVGAAQDAAPPSCQDIKERVARPRGRHATAILAAITPLPPAPTPPPRPRSPRAPASPGTRPNPPLPRARP